MISRAEGVFLKKRSCESESKCMIIWNHEEGIKVWSELLNLVSGGIKENQYQGLYITCIYSFMKRK